MRAASWEDCDGNREFVLSDILRECGDMIAMFVRRRRSCSTARNPRPRGDESDACGYASLDEATLHAKTSHRIPRIAAVIEYTATTCPVSLARGSSQ